MYIDVSITSFEASLPPPDAAVNLTKPYILYIDVAITSFEASLPASEAGLMKPLRIASALQKASTAVKKRDLVHEKRDLVQTLAHCLSFAKGQHRCYTFMYVYVCTYIYVFVCIYVHM
jgi:hypothetical protein